MPVPPVLDKMITLLVALSLQRFQFSLLCLDLFLDLIPLHETEQATNTVGFPPQRRNGFLQLPTAIVSRVLKHLFREKYALKELVKSYLESAPQPPKKSSNSG